MGQAVFISVMGSTCVPGARLDRETITKKKRKKKLSNEERRVAAARLTYITGRLSKGNSLPRMILPHSSTQSAVTTFRGAVSLLVCTRDFFFSEVA